MRYLDGKIQLDLLDRRALMYESHSRSVKCYIPQCPEAGFHSQVGSEIKLERLTHMRHRITANLELKPSPVVDLAEADMPHLTQIPPGTPHRELSANSQDPFDFHRLAKG